MRSRLFLLSNDKLIGTNTDYTCKMCIYIIINSKLKIHVYKYIMHMYKYDVGKTFMQHIPLVIFKVNSGFHSITTLNLWKIPHYI